MQTSTKAVVVTKAGLCLHPVLLCAYLLLSAAADPELLIVQCLPNLQTGPRARPVPSRQHSQRLPRSSLRWSKTPV